MVSGTILEKSYLTPFFQAFHVFHPIFDFAAKKGLVVTPRAQRRFNAMMVAPAR